MKKILIISDGSIGERFIERAIKTYTTDNIYYIVQIKEKKYENIVASRFKFYTFDPTSFSKLSNLLKMEFVQVLIMMDSQVEVTNTIKNIRLVKENLPIVVLDENELCSVDNNLTSINSTEILASRLLDYLPNVPVIAQNVGLGEGEIMEVLVPFGSSFVYRHVGAIEQIGWRISAIYRNRKLILPEPRKMVYPNDLLVIIGEPSVLQSVYRTMKKELGQFPAPFGTNLYLLIDMAVDSAESIIDLLRRSTYIHRQFKHDLIIKIINPYDIEILSIVKSYNSENVYIDINYNHIERHDIILDDISKYHVGLILTSSEMFLERSVRKTLFEGKVPVLAIAEESVAKLKDAIVIISGSKDIEKVATTIFDISMQLELNMEVYNYKHEYQESKIQAIEHFKNLSTIFSKSIKVIETDKNPMRILKNKKSFIQCIPFTEKMTKSRVSSLFSTDSELLYYKLDKHHQIFIPSTL
ncbi:MAG: potassium transporter TrkA [Helicobacteraceae bacterium]|nr:potassium transporter TrkA [Helicobacteraceae bacterium]